MKFSKSTLEVVKNFAVINKSLLFQKGKVLRTISKTPILAEAVIDNEVPEDFGIYDLPRFLSVLTLKKDDVQEFTICDGYALIGSGNQKTKYMFAAPNLFDTPGTKKIQPVEYEVKIPITGAELLALQKSLSILQLPQISVQGFEGKVYIMALNSDNPSSDNYTITLDTTTEHTFSLVFAADSWLFMPGDYIIELSSRMIGYFHTADNRLKYWIPCNKKNSSFVVNV